MNRIVLLMAVLAGIAWNADAEITAKLTAKPTSGDIPLTVQFADTSTATDPDVIDTWSWDLDGDGTEDSTEQYPSMIYAVVGTYTVSLTVSSSSTGATATTTLDVTATTPQTTFSGKDAISDMYALVPLNDWASLCSFTMAFDVTKPAPRALRNLVIQLTPDETGKHRDYLKCTDDPRVDEILEFGIFRDLGKDGPDGVLDDTDVLLLAWDNAGNKVYPADSPSANYDVSGAGDLYYDLNFINPPDGGPRPFDEWITAGPGDGNGYIVAIRTSAVWRNGITLGYHVTLAEMITYNPDTLEPGDVPLNNTGAPVDSYVPNFFNGKRLGGENAYSSSFNIVDMSGSWNGNYNPESDGGVWSWPKKAYRPLGELARPVCQGPCSNFLSVVSGEYLDLRNLFSLETWVSCIGINLHGFKEVPDGDSRLNVMQPKEINLVFTDIGADPLGVPGNGGFDPREALDHVTPNWVLDPHHAEHAVLEDYAFNGVWLFHDTNGNAKFDLPVPSDRPGGGVTLTDFPMLPSGEAMNWEYIPYPPGGGDPWWKIRLTFADGRRRNTDDEEPRGYLEAVPDFLKGSVESANFCDYFVVFRADSGYIDISNIPGDGKGMPLGADFKTFIEPRHFNDATGHLDGGLLISKTLADNGSAHWQDDPVLDAPNGNPEPWWTERTNHPTLTLPFRCGFDVHDLVLTYDSDSRYRNESYWITWLHPLDFCGDTLTSWDAWFDPTLSFVSMFFYHPCLAARVPWLDLTENDQIIGLQRAFETVPFFNAEIDPRSPYYPEPATQPSLPDYATWPQPDLLATGLYPFLTDWPQADRAARILKQHGDMLSNPNILCNPLLTNRVAMLGFNLAGADDQVTNTCFTPTLERISVALWGADFDPKRDLLPLDANGEEPYSGVTLWEDANHDGVFGDQIGGDAMVPLSHLSWSTEPEYIDLDGDMAADDLSGDGVVDESDRAWVLWLVPQTPWPVPHSDQPAKEAALSKSLAKSADVPQDADVSEKIPETVAVEDLNPQGAKALTEATNAGDDLFLVVCPSRSIRRFQQFRAVVPSRLPSRATFEQQVGGIVLSPRAYPQVQAFTKNNPDEDAGQDFYGHDMLEINVPADVLDLTIEGQQIKPGGGAMAVLGIDVSTNRPDGTVAFATGAPESPNQFSTPGETWTSEVVGDWLIGMSMTDQRLEAFEITAASGETLTFRSGLPRAGQWRIVSDPTFLEQLVVEFYDASQDGSFNVSQDLLPLDYEIRPQGDMNSGVAIYRDNDWAEGNTNGVFDPDIDIPLTLDQPPVRTGLVGQAETVKFVFSSPGTDDLALGAGGVGPKDLALQPRNRQWVPDTFGVLPTEGETGPDFFVVVRASRQMNRGDAFRVAVVSWGPNTPTEPDPDNFPPPSFAPSVDPNEFAMFSEFPWESRALGFITFFKNAPEDNFWGRWNVSLHRFEPVVEADHSQDDSPYKYWVRSSANKAGQTHAITADNAPALDFTSDFTKRAPGQDITFTAQAAFEVGSFFWNFGDGLTSTARNSVVHSFALPGIYTVTMTVTDLDGGSDTITKKDYIEITSDAFAYFDATPREGYLMLDAGSGDTYLEVDFTDQSVGSAANAPSTFLWDFGDGAISTDQNPKHRYTEPGIYSVSLETRFQDGSADVASRPNFIVVRQQGGPALAVTPAALALPAPSGNTTVRVQNIGGGTMPWTAAVASGADWLSITSGDGGTDSGTIHLAYTENTDASPRTGAIWIVGAGASGSPVQVSVTQDDPRPRMTVTPAYRLVSYAAGATSLDVANIGIGVMMWNATVVDGGDWVTINAGAIGMDAGTVSISYTENSATEPRVATVRVASTEAAGAPVDITITQAPIPPRLAVTPDAVRFGPNADTASFAVANTGGGTMPWTAMVVSGDPWLTITSGDSGADAGVVAIAVDYNAADTPRTGTVRVTAPGAADSPVDIEVVQIGLAPLLQVTPSDQPVSSGAGSTAFIVANIGIGTMPWTATITEGSDWASISSGASGTNLGEIRVDYLANAGMSPRVAKLLVTAEGAEGSPLEVTLTQAPPPPILSATPSNQDVAFTAGTSSFSIANSGPGTMAWTAEVTSGLEWLRITSGASGSDTGTVAVAFDENTEAAPRIGTVTVTAPGASGSPVDLTVMQAAKPSTLSVSSETLDLEFGSGIASLIVANTGYTGPIMWTAQVTEGSDWLSILTGGSGTDAGTISLLHTANLTPDTRTAVVVVTAPGAAGSPVTVNVTQSVKGPTLEVTPAEQDVPYSNGTVSFEVANSGFGAMPWTASIATGGDWAAIGSGASGNGPGVIVVTYASNALSDSRTATIVVTAPDAAGSPVTLTITQDVKPPTLAVTPSNQSVAGAASETTFTVANTGVGAMPWTAVVTSGSEWLSISDGASGEGNGIVHAAYTANLGTSPRVGSIVVTAPGAVGSPMTVTVTQGVVAPVLAVSAATEDLPGGAGTASLSVSNAGGGAMQWTASVTSGASWLSITSGASGTNTGAVGLAFTANNGSAPRTATVRVVLIGAEGSPAVITLTQSALPPVLSVTPSPRDVSGPAGTGSFTVSNTGGGTMAWTATVTEGGDWLTITSGASGAGSGLVTFLYTANLSGTRTATIEIDAPGVEGSPASVHVNQAPIAPTISVTPGSRDVAATSSSTSFSVGNIGSGTFDWTALVVEGADWISIPSGASGTGPGTINVQCSANTSNASRTGKVQITAEGAEGSPVTVTINQDVLSPILSVTPSTQNAPSGSGRVSFLVSNTGGGVMDWRAAVTEGVFWVSIVSGDSGTNNGQVTLLLERNSSLSSRTGTIRVRTLGDTESYVDVQVVQAGALGSLGCAAGSTSSGSSTADMALLLAMGGMLWALGRVRRVHAR